MKTKETKQTAIIELDKIDPLTLPELASFKEKSLTVVKENPYIEIVDNSTYELAKKARTNLRTNRTELQKQEKAIKDKLNGFKKKVENVTAELIAITEPHEIKQQSEVTRYEDIKEQERLEKARIEQERIDGIKAKIKSFADLFNSKIENLTFAGIDDFKAEFDEFVLIQPKDSFQEFEVLYEDMLSHVTYSFSQKKAVLVAQEQNRLEQVRLAEERAENERKETIKKGINYWFDNWSLVIDGLEFLESKGLFDSFKNEKTLDCQEFQSEYAEKRSLLIQKFESKIALLQQIEDNRIASEKLAKEKSEFEAKQKEARFEERKKELAEIGVLLNESFEFKHPTYSIYASFGFINDCDNDVFEKFINESNNFIENQEQQIKDAAEEVVFLAPESLSSNPYNGILFKEIEVVEPVVVDEDGLGYRIDVENIAEVESWESIHDDFVEFTEIDDSINFYYWLKDNFEAPKRLIK